jgi:hypothetical protein
MAQALTARLDAVRNARAMSRGAAGGPGDVRGVFEELAAGYPYLDWISAAEEHGVIVASNDILRAGNDASAP